MTDNVASLRNTLATYIAHFADLQQEVRRQGQRLDGFQTELDEEGYGRERVDQLEDNLRGAQQEHTRLTGLLDQYYHGHRREHEELRGSLAQAAESLRRDFDSARTRADHLEEGYRGLTRAVDTASARIGHLEDDSRGATGAADSASARIGHLEHGFAGAQDAAHAVSARIGHLEHGLGRAQDAAHSVSARLGHLEDVARALSTRIGHFEGLAEDLHAAARQSADVSTGIQNTLISMKNDADHRHEHYSSAMKNIQGTCDDIQIKYDALHRRYSELDAVVGSLRQQMVEMMGRPGGSHGGFASRGGPVHADPSYPGTGPPLLPGAPVNTPGPTQGRFGGTMPSGGSFGQPQRLIAQERAWMDSIDKLEVAERFPEFARRIRVVCHDRYPRFRQWEEWLALLEHLPTEGEVAWWASTGDHEEAELLGRDVWHIFALKVSSPSAASLTARRLKPVLGLSPPSVEHPVPGIR